MKTTWICCIILFCTCLHLPAQSDSSETLQWVENQAGKIDTLLQDALHNPDQVTIVFRLMDAYTLFDAVAMAGVYCPEIREAAQAGRNQTDVLNYRLEKDVNSGIVRAAQARLRAEQMRVAARICGNAATAGSPVRTFSPSDVIREDVRHIEMMLSDGMAVGDMHLLAQKIEHTLRVLYDIHNLASTFQNCGEVVKKAEKAILHAETALSARNWTEVTQALNNALKEVGRIPAASCR